MASIDFFFTQIFIKNKKRVCKFFYIKKVIGKIKVKYKIYLYAVSNVNELVHVAAHESSSL
jgi:hypothetical protein